MAESDNYIYISKNWINEEIELLEVQNIASTCPIRNAKIEILKDILNKSKPITPLISNSFNSSRLINSIHPSVLNLGNLIDENGELNLKFDDDMDYINHLNF